MLKALLLRRLRSEFRLDWEGIHGAPHWARVRYTGLQLARLTGARADVVEAFAWLHDSQRRNDWGDRGHGERAARYAESINDDLLQLDSAGLQLLVLGCAEHSDGGTDGDVTILTCWDADRLDLGRTGVRPEPSRLCTDAARHPRFLEAAYARSLWAGARLQTFRRRRRMGPIANPVEAPVGFDDSESGDDPARG
jgi:uncharacterized protein